MPRPAPVTRTTLPSRTLSAIPYSPLLDVHLRGHLDNGYGGPRPLTVWRTLFREELQSRAVARQPYGRPVRCGRSASPTSPCTPAIELRSFEARDGKDCPMARQRPD